MYATLLWEKIPYIQVNGVFWPMFWFFPSYHATSYVGWTLSCKYNVFFLIDKPENVQLTTNASANKACQNAILKLNCSVGDANPEVTSYQLFRNGTDVGESNTRMWVQTLSNSGVLMYKCVANNSVGSSETPSVSITVNGNHEFQFSCPPLFTLSAEPFYC